MTLRHALSLPFILAIRLYQVTLSPLLGGHCRFWPSCSRYAMEAYRVHGPVRGTWLTAWRLARCHPLGGGGYDPVPPDERCRK
jgi:putative membrane protein insertion efficiency factor